METRPIAREALSGARQAVLPPFASYWLNPKTWSNPKPSPSAFPALDADLRCDCLVVGGGLCGMLTAHLLAKRGFDVVLLEKEILGHGKTAGTTAKATVSHGVIYSALAESLGPDAAKKYAVANLSGLQLLREVAGPASDARACDFFLYANHGERRLSREYRRMREAGIDCGYFSGGEAKNGGFELPFVPAGVIRVPNQLTFHPLKLVGSLAAQASFRIFEHTEAVSRTGTTVTTAAGHRIRADRLILATNYPVLTPGNLNFLKLYRRTGYAAAFAGTPFLQGCYAGIDGGYAYRSAGGTEAARGSGRDGGIASGEGNAVLIVSSEPTREPPSSDETERLEQGARALFGAEVRTICRWSNNDCYTHDSLPYAGETGDGALLAAGFSSWGMTNAAGAALILSHEAAGEPLWYGDVFRPKRGIWKGGGESLCGHCARSAAGLAQNLAVPDRVLSDIAPGAAGVIAYRGRRVGAYREENGRTHLVSLACPHLGCSLLWNETARTWDCPCHGSRFSYDGTCLSEPSHRGIMLAGPDGLDG